MKYVMVCSKKGVNLPSPGQYATGMFFMDKATSGDAEKQFEDLATSCKIKVLLSLF